MDSRLRGNDVLVVVVVEVVVQVVALPLVVPSERHWQFIKPSQSLRTLQEHPLHIPRMRFATLQTGTKILGSFCIVSLVIGIISSVALWRMYTADAITSDLVNNKLAKQQLTSDLLGVARLNGLRTVSIARSDSLEVSDYFQAQLVQGQKTAADIEGRLAKLPASSGERDLQAAAAARKSAVVEIEQELFRLKDSGQTQAVDELVNTKLDPSLTGYTKSLEALLDHEARQAHQLAEQSAGASRFSQVLLIVLGIGALVVGGLLAWLLTRSIVSPLRQAAGLAELVARGDLRPVIQHARGDEIGRLFDALNRMTSGVSKTVSRVLDGALEIDRASAGIADSNLELSRRTEGQAAALKQTTVAMRELTAVIEQNNVSAHKANHLAQSASGTAIEGAQAVEQVVARMAAIKASAAKIVDITGMIDGIAFQTNLLALNAAVEAARAGNQGRGFAVVAAEVRNLAQHSAEAAREIKQLIGASAGEIAAGTEIANAAGATMRDILDSVQQVTAILSSIDAAGAAQASGIAQVGRAIADMDLATRQNAEMVGQAAAAADSMRSQASALTQQVGTFKIKASPAALHTPMALAAGANFVVPASAGTHTPRAH
jgi:methyl-accepting chemotaxis protein